MICTKTIRLLRHCRYTLYLLGIIVPSIVFGQIKTDSLINAFYKTDEIKAKSTILKDLSRTTFIDGDYASAIYYLQKKSELHLQMSDSIGWADNEYNLGMLYSVTLNFEEATKHSLKAMQYFKRKNLTIAFVNSCINLGYIHNELKQVDNALMYYKFALNGLNSVLNQDELDAATTNLGNFGNALQLSEKNTKPQNQNETANKAIGASLTQVYSALGVLNLKINKVDSAEYYVYRGLELSVANNNQSDIANGQILLGKVYFAQARRPEAYRITERGLETAKGIKNRALVMEAYSELARISMSLKQPGLAYSFLDQYITLKDSIYNEQMSSLLSKGGVRFEISDKRDDKGYLLTENLDQIRTIQNSRIIKWVLFVSTTVIVIFLVIILRKYYVKARKVKELKEKYKTAEDQRNQLENLIQTKDKFLSIIAHDLKNPFNSLLGFADLAYNDFDEISDAEKKSYLKVIRQSGQHIYALLDNLLSWSRAQSGRIDFYPEPVSLTESIENAVELVRNSADNKQITLFSDFSGDVIVKADRNMLSTVLRNLLTNAIKFTTNGGSVTISSSINTKKVTVRVSDTGIGMTPEDLDKLFKLDGGLKTTGTANEIGTGLGLILCQEFMALHKSKIIAESTPGKGSTFSFTLDFIQQL